VFVSGLGSLIFSTEVVCAQAVSDPFERYLNSVETNHRESSLIRFAAECGINAEQLKAKYAVSAGGDWAVVSNLRTGLKSLDSDFYTAAEVWRSGDSVATEVWPVSDDVGSEVRVLSCYLRGDLRLAEAVQWNMPTVGTDIKAWGYSRRWERGSQGQLKQTQAYFVDENERMIAKPKLDAESEETLRWVPELGPLSALKFPVTLLQ
jgi:hypothetical protein